MSHCPTFNRVTRSGWATSMCTERNGVSHRDATCLAHSSSVSFEISMPLTSRARGAKCTAFAPPPHPHSTTRCHGRVNPTIRTPRSNKSRCSRPIRDHRSLPSKTGASRKCESAAHRFPSVRVQYRCESAEILDSDCRNPRLTRTLNQYSRTRTANNFPRSTTKRRPCTDRRFTLFVGMLASLATESLVHPRTTGSSAQERTPGSARVNARIEPSACVLLHAMHAIAALYRLSGHNIHPYVRLLDPRVTRHHGRRSIPAAIFARSGERVRKL